MKNKPTWLRYAETQFTGLSLRDIGKIDFEAGKPIDAFYALPMKRHTEGFRAEYEIGWRAASASRESVVAESVATLWDAACKHDGIDPTSKFVCWSDSNPYAASYNDAMGRLLELRGSRARK